MRATLYRYFDKHGTLLYVGITTTGPQRQRGHNASAPWWRSVATATFTHYQSLRLALAAEREAIQTERPVWNKVHSLVTLLTTDEMIAAVEAYTRDHRAPYTLDQLAQMFSMRADLLLEHLEANGILPRGRRYSMASVIRIVETVEWL